MWSQLAGWPIARSIHPKRYFLIDIESWNYLSCLIPQEPHLLHRNIPPINFYLSVHIDMAIPYNRSNKHHFAMESNRAPETCPPPPYTPESQYSIGSPESHPAYRSIPREIYTYESRSQPLSYPSQPQYPSISYQSQQQYQSQYQAQYHPQAQWNGPYPYIPAGSSAYYQSQQLPAQEPTITTPSYRPEQQTQLQKRPSRTHRPCVIPREKQSISTNANLSHV